MIPPRPDPAARDPAARDPAAPGPARPADPAQLRHVADVILALVRRDQKARYRSTAMGVVWAVASPLLFLLIFWFLFAVVVPLGIADYASYVMIGITVWGWLGTSVAEAVNVIPWNASLVNQPRFPVAALPVATVLSNFVTFLLTWPVLFGLLWVDGLRPGPALLALPVLMAVQFVLILALAYLVAALNVLFRDMQYIAPILLQLGYFLTPIFYDIGAVGPGVRQALALNPMLHLVEGYRAVLIGGDWPDWGALSGVLGASAVLLVLTLRFFRQSRFRFLEEI